jgi:ABC-type multidrug transport system ATPase subunit
MNSRSILISQASDEVKLLKRVILYLQQENVTQKGKLVEILKNQNGDLNFLEQVENYQNQFLQQDETFRLFWTDLSRLEKSFGHSENMPWKTLCRQQEELKREIELLDKNYFKLKKDFDNFSSTSTTDLIQVRPTS